MISEYMKILFAPVARVHGGTASPPYLPPVGAAKPFGNILRRLRALFDGIDRKRRIEYENRRAIAHLESLSDERLRDIGIGRYEIERRVRLGRDAI
jgi:uncharacterized protein YjiS (DUF1127 family)